MVFLSPRSIDEKKKHHFINLKEIEKYVSSISLYSRIYHTGVRRIPSRAQAGLREVEAFVEPTLFDACGAIVAFPNIKLFEATPEVTFVVVSLAGTADAFAKATNTGLMLFGSGVGVP